MTLEFEGDRLVFESASFLGVLTNDFSNRTEVELSSDFTTPVVARENTSVAASLTDGSDLPPWLMFDAVGLVFSGEAPDATAAPFEVALTFTYTNPHSSEVVQYNDTITIDPAAASELTSGVAYDSQLAVFEAGSGTFSARLETGRDLPTWLFFDPNTPAFSRTEIEPGRE